MYYVLFLGAFAYLRSVEKSITSWSRSFERSCCPSQSEIQVNKVNEWSMSKYSGGRLLLVKCEMWPVITRPPSAQASVSHYSRNSMALSSASSHETVLSLGSITSCFMRPRSSTGCKTRLTKWLEIEPILSQDDMIQPGIEYLQKTDQTKCPKCNAPPTKT